MARVLYCTCNCQQPSGGVKIIFRHVEALVDAGLDACVIGTTEAGPAWLATRAPYRDITKTFEYRPDDIVVVPEHFGDQLRFFAGKVGRRYVFCQSLYGLLEPASTLAHINAGMVEGVIACSARVAEVVAATTRARRVDVVRNGVDCDLFRPSDKILQVALVGTRPPDELAMLRTIFVALAPDLAAIPWVRISGTSEAEVARRLGESAVFLSMQCREGWGLPALEALAAEAVVAGYRGGVAAEYAEDATGLWCRDEHDVFECATMLKQALLAVRDDTDLARRLRAAGRHAAERYSQAAMRRSVVAFWQSRVG